MKTLQLAISTCLILLTTSCQNGQYTGPSVGVTIGYGEISLGLKLFSAAAPSTATSDLTLQPEKPVVAPATQWSPSK